MKDEISNLTDQLNKKGSTIEQLQSTIQSLNTSLNTANTNISNLQNSLNTANTNISNLQNSLNAVSTKLSIALPSSISNYAVKVSYEVLSNALSFSTIQFPNADKYNISFSIENAAFSMSRFSYQITRSGINITTTDSDIIYWVNSRYGKTGQVVTFYVSGTLK